MNARTIAVLGYHKIGEPPNGEPPTWFYIPGEIFARQLQCLQDNGWEAISLAQFLEGLDDPEILPPRATLITFDDGCRSILGAGIECLRRFGFPAVMFVPTDYIGRTT